MTKCDRYSRMLPLVGSMTPLENASVLLVGAGGVGGYAFEMLMRSGIGEITVVDGDVFEESNLNRQILSTMRTLGQNKAEAAAERGREVNPDCRVRACPYRFCTETAAQILDRKYDYVADCIDSVPDKVLLIRSCVERDLPIISAMGAGNRLDCDFTVTDISKTQNDGLAKAVRKRLREIGITSLKVVASKQPPSDTRGASIAYPPAVMGCMLAGEVIRELVCR